MPCDFSVTLDGIESQGESMATRTAVQADWPVSHCVGQVEIGFSGPHGTSQRSRDFTQFPHRASWGEIGFWRGVFARKDRLIPLAEPPLKMIKIHPEL